MKLLTTAAVALALTGAAAAAHADQPQQNNPQGQHQGGHQGGGQAQGQGGQPHYRAPAGGQHNFAGPQGGQHNFAGPQGGQHFQPNAQVQQFNGPVHQGQGGGAGFNGQVQQGQGAGAGFNGQGNGRVQQWHGLAGGQGAGGQPNGQVQRWNGQRGAAFNGQPGARYNGQVGQRGNFGFQDHALRGRDQGRAYFNARAFAPQYHAERRFRFSGYRHYPHGWYVRSWDFGEFLPWGWFAPEYYLDWADYGLPPPPVGCEWVANGPDALLVDIWTGEVLSVYQGVFYWNGY